MGQKIISLLLVLTTGCSFLNYEPSSLAYKWRNRASHRVIDTELYFTQAAEAFDSGDFELAESRLNEILNVQPGSLRAFNNLGRLYFDQQKYYLAAKHFSQALELSEAPDVQLNHLGLVYEAIGKYDLAETYFLQAKDISPDCIIYTSHLARVYVKQNRRDFVTEDLLSQVAEKEDREGWRSWASLQLTKIREKNLREARDSQALVAENVYASEAIARKKPLPEFPVENPISISNNSH